MINKIQDNFYCITLPMPFRLKHVHVYALVNNREIALFDTGFNVSGSLEKLEKDLTSIGQSIKSIRDIYITHGHADHCGMAGLIKEKSGAIIHLSAAADESNQNYNNTDLLTTQMRKFYLLHGMTEQEVEGLIVIFSGLRNIISPFQGDDHLQFDKICEFGNWNFKVLFTPGHSNGHVCYYFPKEKFLFSGDTVLPQITPNLSPDLVDEDFRPLHSFLQSLQLLDALDVEKIYPGHGNVFSDLKTRTKEMREHHIERTGLIMKSLSFQPKTSFQVSQVIFGSNLPDFDKFLALNETYVHLLELKLKGAIKEDRNRHNLVYRLS